MQIRRIDTFLLKAPLAAGERFWSSQAAFPERKCLLVRIETHSGVVGWGEAGQYGPAEPVVSQIHDVLAPLLIGQDALQPAVHWEHMYNHTRDFGAKGSVIEAISGIDIALWDILGKARGAPVCELLGGAFRDSVQTYATGLYYRGEQRPTLAGNLPQLKEEAARWCDAGFPALKAKIGILSPAEDVERIGVTRDVIGGHMLLMVDANHAYHAHVAAQVARAIEPYNIYWFEEPVPPEDMAGYQQVKASTTIAIAGGECEHTRYGFARWFAARAIDIAQPDTCAAGGISELNRIIAMASAFHVQCMPHVWGSGISIAAGLQLLAAIPPSPHTAIPHAPFNEPMLEWDAARNPLRTDLLENPLQPIDGRVPLPTEPGIGAVVSMSAVNQYVVSSRASE